MQVELETDAVARVIVLKVSGDLGDRELASLRGHLENAPGVEPDFSLLIDLRQARGQKVSSVGVRSLATAPVMLSSGSRRAIVVSGELAFGMARMYQMLREYEVSQQKRSNQLRIFRDYESAQRWAELGVS